MRAVTEYAFWREKNELSYVLPLVVSWMLSRFPPPFQTLHSSIMLSSFRKVKVQVFSRNAWSVIATLACLYCNDLFVTRSHLSGSLSCTSYALFVLQCSVRSGFPLTLWIFHLLSVLHGVWTFNGVWTFSMFRLLVWIISLRAFCSKEFLSNIFLVVTSKNQPP